MEQPLALDPAGRDIHGESALLRERGPATRVVLPGDIAAWAVTGHALLKTLLTDDRVNKDPKNWGVWQRGEITPDMWIYTWVAVNNMFTAAGSDHRRLRKLITPAFTGRRIEALRPTIQKIADGLLDDMAASSDGTADLRSAYAHPLPMQVICHLFGLPEKLQPRMALLVERVFDTTIEDAASNFAELQQMLGDLIALKRAEPADDMTSVLIATRDDDGTRLSEAELTDTLLLIISAGFETTVNLIGNATRALLEHPDQRKQVTADGAGRWGDVIEETLRWEPSVAHLPMRYAVEDIELPDGQVIPKGDAILAAYAAAGREPALHGDDADAFDIDRAKKEHLAFGYGVHFCVGAPLARLEADVALTALFARFPELALGDGELTPVESFISNGSQRIPVALNGA
ncbi:cytochrome P450 family protein [Streptomyces beijiangensis]|uniref:Cytochrome P450 n=1 Tax=Streptomyces beijiangensis TaxID=163361 RepID=A0A939F8A1_9ACTN|nr:cytochrome P450 [Streptomyces beijiangensis]MBO0514446.1 cytochrome P450 [Streptomyces beijiangensis]